MTPKIGVTLRPLDGVNRPAAPEQRVVVSRVGLVSRRNRMDTGPIDPGWLVLFACEPPVKLLDGRICPTTPRHY